MLVEIEQRHGRGKRDIPQFSSFLLSLKSMARGNATMTRHGLHKDHGLPGDAGASPSSRGDDKGRQAQSTSSKPPKSGAKERMVLPVSRSFQFCLLLQDRSYLHLLPVLPPKSRSLRPSYHTFVAHHSIQLALTCYYRHNAQSGTSLFPCTS